MSTAVIPIPAHTNAVITTINAIDSTVVQYVPLAITTMAAIEQAAARIPGETKAQIVTNVIMAAAQGVQNVPNPTVSAIGGMIALFVAIFNATGLFQHKAAPIAPAAVVK